MAKGLAFGGWGHGLTLGRQKSRTLRQIRQAQRARALEKARQMDQSSAKNKGGEASTEASTEQSTESE